MAMLAKTPGLMVPSRAFFESGWRTTLPFDFSEVCPNQRAIAAKNRQRMARAKVSKTAKIMKVRRIFLPKGCLNRG
jgi:hypothetical protein